MISSRVMLVAVPSVLILITIISTAPIHNNELVMEKLSDKSPNTIKTIAELMVYDDDKDTSNESKEQNIESTTHLQEVIATDIRVVNITEISLYIDDMIKASDNILANIEAELSAIATTEKLESSQSNQDDDDDE
ncbi:unnamed protein product [Rotaria sordida]|uniref:Uncharacterized protein n=1 Tax=Rotaria sordida TaxID=392033 RepID=A0A818Z4T2_9BILA|nr:unnamed protein product [Rotaria sordida]CAF1368615.1 unnamed protein product [Rotaria sordida]CAF3764895.1 unnamed protein product [Rotaria sordida]CAF3789797.1 unnamed protein product [Rotaria sordida]